MTTRRRILRAALAVAGFAVLVAALGAALAPRWINLVPVRGRIEAAASSALGGAVRYGRIDLTWSPRPKVVLRDVEVSVPGTAKGSVRAVALSPAVLPLLRGRVRLTGVAVDGPDLTVEVPVARAEAPAAPGDPLAGIRALVPEGRALTVELRGGRVTLVRRGETLLAVEGLDVRAGLAAKGSGAVRADLRLSVPALLVRRDGGRSLSIDGLVAEGTADLAGGSAAVTLDRLSSESPRLLASGTLRTGGPGAGAEMAVRGEGLDVTGFRAKLLSFGGDVPVLAAVLAILRGGTLTAFSVASRGETPGDLGVFERMSIRATLAGGSVRIAGAGLDFRAASGEVAIDGGALSAEHVSAEVGKSEVRDGSVLVGLTRDDDRLRVDAGVRADLAEMPGILSRAIRDPAFREELSLVEALEGSASGRIALEGTLRSMRTAVSISGMRLSARYRRVPWPLRIDAGSFTFDGRRVGLDRLAGRVGGSALSGLSARVRLGTPPFIERLSGTIEAPLADLHSGLASLEGMEPLRTAVRRVDGDVHVSVARLSGPLATPRGWAVEAEGRIRDLLLDAAFLPAPLAVSSGGIQVDGEAIRATALETRTMDAALRVSGTVRGYREGVSGIEATVDGEVGPEGVRLLWRRASLPRELLPTAPIGLRDVRLALERPGGGFSLAGTFVAARGAEVTLGLATGPDGLEIPDLTVADGDARATMALHRDGAALGIRFQGRLLGSTVAKLLQGRPEARGRVEGDFRALFPAGRAGRARTEGTLSAHGIDVPTPAGELTVERLDLRGADDRLTATDSSLVLDGQRFRVTGGAAVGGGRIGLDLDVAAGEVDWPWIGRIANRIRRPSPSTPEGAAPGTDVPPPGEPAGSAPPAASPPAVRGALRVSLESFRYGGFTWKPVVVEVGLGGDSVSATVSKAEVCGISTTGAARFRPDGTAAVDGSADATGPDVGAALSCLGVGEAGLTGRYEATVRAEADGKLSQLLGSARGRLSFKAAEGRLGKVNVLTRVLAVLNATDVFAGGESGRLGQAMPFRELSVEGGIGDGAVSVREGSLSTPSFTMVGSGRVGYLDGSLDVMVLSQPLSTLDKVVQAVPVVRTVLGKDFLSVAARVTGTVSDPKVKVSPARDVGKGLVNILERTVKLPVTVFDPPASRDAPR